MSKEHSVSEHSGSDMMHWVGLVVLAAVTETPNGWLMHTLNAANLVGRLLPLWDVCSRNSSQAWQSIAQAREEKGRPYLVGCQRTSPIILVTC